MKLNTPPKKRTTPPKRNKYWMLGLTIFALLLSSCSGDTKNRHNYESPQQTKDVTASSKPEFDEAPSWLYGEWQCQSNYGLMGIKITPDQIIEVMPDGEVSTSRWHMQGTTLMTDGASGTYYDLDIANQRIAFGGGYFFYKVR